MKTDLLTGILISDTVLYTGSFIFILISLKNAVKIEYNIRIDYLLNSLYNDDRILFRIALRLKLWFLLAYTVGYMASLGGKILGSQLPFVNIYQAIVSFYNSIIWFLISLLMYLIYSKKSFDIFKIVKKNE